MVHIVTGPVNSGKTTRLHEIHNSAGTGDGFLLWKQFAGGVYLGQRIEGISSCEELEFSRIFPFIPPVWDEAARYRNYSFSRKGLEFAADIILNMLARRDAPVFMDEIGPLELNGGGFCPLLKKVLGEGAEAYLTVRDQCLGAVIDEFHIRRFVIERLPMKG